MDALVTGGAPIGIHGDNGGMHNMDFNPWATASGEEV